MSITKNIAKISCAKCKTSFVSYMPDDECGDCGGKLTKVRWAKFTKPEDFISGCELVLEAENYHGQAAVPMALYRRIKLNNARIQDAKEMLFRALIEDGWMLKTPVVLVRANDTEKELAHIAERVMAATVIDSGPRTAAQVAFRHAEALYAEGVKRGIYPEDVT